MVRVTNPSGGSARYSETQREPKTVRVLKPPGGESSISFTDDHDFTKRPAKYGPQKSPSVENGKTEPAKESPPTLQEEKEETNGSATPVEKETTPAKETNGTVKIANDSSDPIPSSPTPPSPTEVVADGSLDVPTAEKVITNGSTNGSVHDVSENGTHHDTVNFESDTKESAVILPEIPEPVINDFPSVTESSEHKTKANLPPLLIKTSTHSSSQNSPTSVTPSVPSPTVSSPSVKGQEDTKDRLFGSPMALASPPVEQPQPRKVVDHMRSSIFGPDDSYAPRSSRNNASPPTPTSHQDPIERPTAGQRGRVPPGGFSTKLW